MQNNKNKRSKINKNKTFRTGNKPKMDKHDR